MKRSHNNFKRAEGAEILARGKKEAPGRFSTNE